MSPDLADLASKLATALGPGWRVRAEEDGQPRSVATLEGPDHAVLGLHLTSHPSRLWVTAKYPSAGGGYDHGPNDATRRPRISVDPARPVTVIAKDIARRVLAVYLAELPEALRRRADPARIGTSFVERQNLTIRWPVGASRGSATASARSWRT